MPRQCDCVQKKEFKYLYVVQRNENCSAFNGYHPQWSEYSCVVCVKHYDTWRTKAKYVDSLLSATYKEIEKLRKDYQDKNPGCSGGVLK